MPLSVEQKKAILAESEYESAIHIAAKYGVSRARVYQIKREDPAFWLDFKPKLLPEKEILRFASRRLKSCVPAMVQQAILTSSCSDKQLARVLGISTYAVSRVRYAAGKTLKSGGSRRMDDASI